MDLYEYQARDLFAAHSVPVLPGRTASTPEGAAAVASEIGTAVVVKAQVKTGGRGKAGGVKLATTPEEAREKAAAILGMFGRESHASLFDALKGRRLDQPDPSFMGPF